MVTVYAVASAKGGVGKTTTTAAIATILAESGADVVAIDADIGMANLADAVGVTPGETTIHDVLAGAADPLDAVHDGPVGLRVVPGAADLDAYAAADPSGLKDVVAAFSDADYVFVDAGAGLSHDSTLPLGIADETLLVSTAERSALGDTEKTRQLTERLGGTVAGAAITRVSGDGEIDDGDLVAELLDTAVLGRIPEDESVVSAADATEPLSLFAPDSPATRAYRDLTRALTGADIAGDGLTESTAVAGVDGNDGVGESESEDRESEGGADADSGDDSEIESGESNDTSEVDEDIVVADEAVVPADEEANGSAESADSNRPERSDEPDDRGGSGGDEAEAVRDGAEVADDRAEAVDDRAEAVDDETEMVGEEHVSGDDLEAMIEEDVDEAYDDDGGSVADTEDAEDVEDAEDAEDADPIADADEVAAKGGVGVDGEVDEREDNEAGLDDDGIDGEETDDEGVDGESRRDGTDIDDELAGSVPFRDDDTGTRNAVGSGSDGEDDDRSADKETDDEKKGGFFSRLLGR